MQFEDLVPGVVVKVPAGVGLRTHTCYLRITGAHPSEVPNSAHIQGRTVRADGSPSRCKRGGGRADFVYLDQFVLISQPDPKEEGADHER